MRRTLLVVLVAVTVVLAGCSMGGGNGAGSGNGNGAGAGDGSYAGNGNAAGDAAASGASGSESVGVSVGGAQDANAFRRNVEEGFVPQPTDIVAEGIYHDYFFETDLSTPCEARFCAAYDRAVARIR